MADTNNHRIRKFDSTGVYLSQWGTFGSGDGEFNQPHGVATSMDSTIKINVADTFNHRIQKFGYPLDSTPAATLTATLTPSFTPTATTTTTPTATTRTATIIATATANTTATATATSTPIKTTTQTETPTTITTATPTKTPTKTATATATKTATKTATLTDLSNAIELEGFMARAEGNKVVLTWKTGSEIDNLGYYIVKSESVDNGYTFVNNMIIPAQGNAYSGHSYSYVDSNVNAGHIYYYWLADVDVYGKYEIHGPVKVITNIKQSS